MTRSLKAFILIITSLVASGLASVYAADTIDREYPLKAAYLYNIFKFISLPEREALTPEQIQLCIIGQNHANEALLELNNKRIENIIINVQTNVNINNVNSCRVLYFTHGEIDNRLDHLAEQGLLLIGEQDDFMAKGGTLNFFVENNKLRFAINVTVAKKAGITISSKLLSLARIYDN